jgi:hypothetical protein
VTTHGLRLRWQHGPKERGWASHPICVCRWSCADSGNQRDYMCPERIYPGGWPHPPGKVCDALPEGIEARRANAPQVFDGAIGPQFDGKLKPLFWR